jgi:putative phosphoesterase
VSAASAAARCLGVVADSHGHLCEATLAHLEGVDAILHAGDIGDEVVLARLRELAPVVAVVGNGDPDLTHRYPWEQHVELEGFRILLCHWYDNHGTIHPRVARELERWRPHVLVYGHTHRAHSEAVGGTLHFNPGYAGAPEPGRRRSVGRLHLGPEAIRGEILPLPDA